MKVEFLVKYAKTKEGIFDKKKETDEERTERLNEEKIKRIIGGDEEEEDVEFSPDQNIMTKLFDPKNLDIYYQPHVMDFKDICDFYPFDKDHVIIIKDTGDLIPVKSEWEYFRNRYEELLQEKIVKF